MSEIGENQTDGIESPEVSVDQRLAAIAEEVGFKETPELVQARKELKPDELIDDSKEKIIAYQKLGEELVEAGQDTSGPKPQIGLIIAIARLKYANGFYDDYQDDLTDAMFLATNIGDHETVKKLRRIFFEYLESKK